MRKKIVLLINLGTPDSPTFKSVAKYLFEFLNDKFVINLPWLFRSLLVNCIIIPFRVFRSTDRYKELWTPSGSPLRYFLLRLADELQTILPKNYEVHGAMRYRAPSIRSTLKKIATKDVEEIIAIPLYPQYASSTSETSIQELLKAKNDLNIRADIKIVEQFYFEPSYVNTFASHIQTYQPERFDHILFSFHGLPSSQIQRCESKNMRKNNSPTRQLAAIQNDCYLTSCTKTVELLANTLDIPADKYSIAFQSRMSVFWIKPFTDKVLMSLLKTGKKKVLVIAPSFVADCLETTIELGVEYKELFLKNGGEEFVMVESLNISPNWVEALAEIVKKY
ncbi:MAG: ferrochelatase [Paludibacteraceae bacterium]